VGAYNLPSHWYPEDPKKRARVDQYLAWHHGAIRNGLFFYVAIAPAFGTPVEEGKVDKLKAELKKGLELFQNYFLSGEGPFILGAEISIADVQCLCELTQFWIMQVKIEDNFPKIKAWMKACQDHLGDAFEKVHAKVYEMAKSGEYKKEMKLD
jgi:glutathione S-transferase